MLQIELKTTGFLIDEIITCKFKIKDGIEGSNVRLALLTKVISSRMDPLGRSDMVRLCKISAELESVSRICWDAQEKVCSLHVRDSNIGIHAKRAQEVNAQRTALIRKIDLLLGEGEITVLEKTYERRENL